MAAAVNPTSLRSEYDPAGDTITIELDAPLPHAARLALTSIVQLTPADHSSRLVSRLGTYHEFELESTSAAMTLSHAPRHANDGPVSGFLILAQGATSTLRVHAMQRRHGESDHGSSAHDRSHNDLAAVVPFPRELGLGNGHVVTSLAWSTGPEVARLAWQSVSALERRLTGTSRLDTADGLMIVCHQADIAGYRITIEGGVGVTAADETGFRYAFITLAQLLTSGLTRDTTIDDAPHWLWRVLHIDLARQWFEPEVVERLIDLAAWRKLTHLHLHLTDDEAWRLPVEAYPELAVAGTRGHGMRLPPMLGGGPEAVGRAYTPGEIERWRHRANAVGVMLIPEVDLPAHVHAALAALPWLRDPADLSGAVSVQYFVDNVLVPGLPATERFVADVLDATAHLFPDSPYIHIGGDEVPDGAWSASPVVTKFRQRHELRSRRDVEAVFHRRVVETVRTRHDRRIGAWQEAAESGGVQPGDGYVVGWRTAEVSRQLAAAGHDVIVSPGTAYYLDMASDPAWDAPGASWAGHITLNDVCGFDPVGGWSTEERSRLLGVQACIWTEHVHDQRRLYEMLFPRLDAIAERGWRGSIAGGAPSLRTRSERLRQSSA